MAKLILDSLEIKSFRAFQHLLVPHLARVNLVVGKNQVGKTSLLEALWLYARRGAPLLMWELLKARDESVRFGERSQEDKLSAIHHLFYEAQSIRDELEAIEIGPLNSAENRLSISVGWYTSQVDEAGHIRLHPLLSEAYNAVDHPILGLAIELSPKAPLIYHLLRPVHDLNLIWSQSEHNEINCMFISVKGLDQIEITQLWDRIALTNREEEVMRALRIIAPEVERISLVSRRNGSDQRIGLVKIKQRDEPFPLRRLGDGITRLFGIALALVNAKDGILLIDEIENGLHYSLQPDIWHFIFRVARRLNVQVFATSHSWEMIEAFQEAAQKGFQSDALLIRLENKSDNRIIPTIFDYRKLAIATREYIEVR